MKIFGNSPTFTEKKSRNIEIDAVQKEIVDYTDKVIKDPRIKKYRRPDFSNSDVHKKLDDFRQKQLEDKQKHSLKMDKQKILNEKKNMVETGEQIDIPKGDIASNDPTDSNTRNKLKDAVRMGSFAFSQKEREVLNQILSNND